MRHVEARLLSCLLVVVCAGNHIDAAQGPPAQEAPLTRLSLAELGNIEVTSVSKGSETLLRSPAAIYVITQEDIRRSGATNLPELLRSAPGLNVARIDSGHWSVGVRGFGDQFSKSLLVLIDGRSVYTPLFAGIYWAAQDTLLEDIDRIEVIRGPGGTIWGANAVNGVINIITKPAQETSGTIATVGGGNVDHSIAAVRYGGTQGSQLAYRLYGKTFRRGPQSHSDDRDFDDANMGQAGFRADWTRPDGSITLQGDLYKGSVGQSVVFGSLSPPSDITLYEPAAMSGGNLLARWHRRLARGAEMHLLAFYDRTSVLGPQIGESRNTFDVDFVHHLATIRRHDLRWGLGMRLSPSQITQTVPGLDVSPHDHTSAIYTGFVEDQVALVPDKLWATIGSKLEHNDYTGAEAQPSVRLLWKPDDQQSLWAAATRAVRTPSRLERSIQLVRFLGANPPTFLRLEGNSDFRSEQLLGYEAGYRRAVGDRLFVDVAAFHNRHEDLESFGTGSVRVETTPPPARVLLVVPFANTILGESNGFEVAPDWKPTAWWQLRGSYSHLRINLRNTLAAADPFNVVATYEGSSPRHRFVMRPRVTLPKGWEIDPSYRYISALAGRRADAYHGLDLRIGWQARPDLTLSVVSQNLSPGRHVEFAHDPPPDIAIKRSVYASLVWRR